MILQFSDLQNYYRNKLQIRCQTKDVVNVGKRGTLQEIVLKVVVEATNASIVGKRVIRRRNVRNQKYVDGVVRKGILKMIVQSQSDVIIVGKKVMLLLNVQSQSCAVDVRKRGTKLVNAQNPKYVIDVAWRVTW